VTFGARARIRLGAVKHNFQFIKDRSPGTRVMAVVKGNAYGHGMVPVAQALKDADCFAVARLAEAAALREAGIDKPLTLLGGVLSRDDLSRAIALGVEVCVHNDEQIRWLEDCGESSATVWLKIDTGMNRLGFRTDVATDVIARLRRCTAVTDLRLMTHFANADDPDDDMTQRQIDEFVKIAADFDGDISVANSAALFGFTNALNRLSDAYDADRLWVRPGIALYGVSPLQGRAAADLGLQAAMQFESRLAAVKPVHRGDRVGYGGTWHASQDSVLGVVSVGYGDGYTRYVPAGTPVLINGRTVPVVGRISMDLTTVDLGEGASDRAGDRVILWGESLPVESIAEHAGTLAYQLLTGVTHREAPVFDV